MRIVSLHEALEAEVQNGAAATYCIGFD